MFKIFSKHSVILFLLLLIGSLSYYFFVNYMESVEVDLALSMVNSNSKDEIERLDFLNNIENFSFIVLLFLYCVNIFSLINDYTQFLKRNK